MHQIQQPEEHILLFYWVESFGGSGGARRSSRISMDQQDASWMSALGVCWEITVRISPHLAEFHMAVNLANACCQHGENYLHHNWLGIINLYNIFTIQQSSTQILFVLWNHFLFFCPASLFLLQSLQSLCSIPTCQGQLALTHLLRDRGKASSVPYLTYDRDPNTILLGPLVQSSSVLFSLERGMTHN